VAWEVLIIERSFVSFHIYWAMYEQGSRWRCDADTIWLIMAEKGNVPFVSFGVPGCRSLGDVPTRAHMAALTA
jgi:hypothetical protein